jgi:hypothetical protein
MTVTALPEGGIFHAAPGDRAAWRHGTNLGRIGELGAGYMLGVDVGHAAAR